MDPGYAVAARRRAEGEPTDPTGPTGPTGPRPRRRFAWRASAVVVVVGAALGLAAGAGVAQLRAGPLQAQDRAVLESEVERRTAIADDLAAANARLRAEIEADQAVAIGEGAESLLGATEELGVVSGGLPVTGPGVVVTLDDAVVDQVAPAEDGSFADDGRVRDVDVQTVVNGLWAAGAEAVAINGQRLTSLSTIRHAGSAIVVDLRQLARPYTITAVGDQRALLEEARTGVAGRYAAVLRDSYGVSVSVDRADDVVLPAASRLSLRHATGVEDPTAPVEDLDEGPEQQEVGQS